MLRPSKITVLLVLVSMGALGCFNKTGPRSSGEASLSWKDPARIDAWLAAYNASAFGYCDAELLGAFWRHSVEDAKARVGMKLAAGAQDYEIEKWHLAPAREQAIAQGRRSCDIYAEGYAYEDLKAVAFMMGISEAEAKALMGEKLFFAGRSYVDKLVNDAQYSVEGEYYYDEGEYDEEGYYAEKFWIYDYPWCDAVVIAKAWSVDTWDAKVTIGQKLANGLSPEEIEANLLSGLRQQLINQGQGCDLSDGGYKLQDAESLACFWGAGLEETKARMSRKITLGTTDWLDSQLDQARETCPQ
ncbi:MAG: hypothetical protein H6740_14345 [Alphaproteobacteria bacterium]|nr:hypothetical protein [Alphaproteobacteria bacterium]